MMKKLYLLLAFTGLAALSQAQTSNDPAAKKVLDAVSAKFKSFRSVKAGFNYKVENSAGKTMSSKNGTILMKGTKYRVSFGDQEIFSDGKTVWNYDKSTNEVTVNNLDAASGTITPQKLFTDFYDKDFLYKMNGDKKIGSKTVQEIEMTPTDKSKPFFKVYVNIDKAAQTLYSTKVMEKAGGRYTYTVSSMSPNATVSDAQFVFDKSKYPGVEVVDLR